MAKRDLTHLSLRLPREDLRALEDLARELGEGRSAAARLALRAAAQLGARGTLAAAGGRAPWTSEEVSR